MFMLMSPMVARVSMLMTTGFRMGMNVSMLMDMLMSMALPYPMLVRMAMFMFVLMVAFHTSLPFVILLNSRQTSSSTPMPASISVVVYHPSSLHHKISIRFSRSTSTLSTLSPSPAGIERI